MPPHLHNRVFAGLQEHWLQIAPQMAGEGFTIFHRRIDEHHLCRGTGRFDGAIKHIARGRFSNG